MRTGKASSWFEVTQKNRNEDVKRIEKGLQPRFASEDFSANPGKVTSTPEFDKWLSNVQPKYDEQGHRLPCTARGKRRRLKRQGG